MNDNFTFLIFTYCNDWSEASGFTCSKMFIEQRQKQTGNGQQAKTGISEAEQRRKQYQAGVEVTGTGSEFQGQAVQGQTQRWQEDNAQNVSQGNRLRTG